VAKKKEKELSDKAIDAANEAAEKVERLQKQRKEAAIAERKRKAEAAKVFGCPEWVEKEVLSRGDRGAQLWRSLSATWGKSGNDRERLLKSEWDKFSKDIEKE